MARLATGGSVSTAATLAISGPNTIANGYPFKRTASTGLCRTPRAIPKVQDRISSVRRGEAPVEPLRAYRATNRREDNAAGHLREGKAIVIKFPGKNEAEEKFPSVRQQGAIDGIVTRVGYCKLHHGVPILRNENDAFKQAYDQVIRPLSYEDKLKTMMVPLDMPVTRIMTTDQKTRYLDAIAQGFLEQGVALTEPEGRKVAA